MKISRWFLLMMLLVLPLAACGGGGRDPTVPTNPNDPTQPSQPTSPGPVASVTVTPSSSNLEVNGSVQLTATALDVQGRIVTGRVFRWESSTPVLATVSSAGNVLANSPTNATVAAVIEQGNSVRGITSVAVSARPRIPGSILTLGYDTLVAQVSTTKLAMVDTAKAGKDYRLGIVHVASAAQDKGTVSRANWPLLRVVTECSTGEVYASENSSDSQGDRIWKIDLRTAISTLMGDIDIGPTDVTAMLCEPSGSILLVGAWSGITNLYRYTPTSGVRGLKQYDKDYIIGMARSPAGIIYVTARNTFDSSGGVRRIMTMDPVTFALKPVVERSLPHINRLEFRGNRLFGFSGRDLVELDVQTGAMAQVRATAVP